MKKILFFLPLLLIFLQLKYNTDGPNTWTQSLSTTSAVWQDGIVINSTNPSIMYAGTAGAGVYKTTNSGVNWVQVNNGLTNLVVQSMAISKSNPNIIMVGTTNTGSSPGVYKSTDAGANWTLKINGITESGILPQAIAIDPTDPNVAYTLIFTGTANAVDGVFKTTNGGDNWFVATTGIGSIKNFLSIVINPLNHNVLYIGSSFDYVASTGPQKIYKSVNAGATWVDVSTGLPSLTTDINPVRTMSISNADTGVVLAGLFQNSTTNGGAFFTTNGGGQWTKIQNGLPNVVGALIRSAIIRPGTSTEFYLGFDGTTSTGVWRTTNQGTLWTNFSGGALLSTYIIRSFAFKTSPDSTLYAGVAGTAGMGVYEYSFIPVGISGQNGNIPKEFALHQNYPNPFNPSTVISFDIPRESFVTVKIYDISGKEVKTILNETRRAGSYNITFNASSLSSGVYFYKITAGEFVSTKKMALVK